MCLRVQEGKKAKKVKLESVELNYNLSFMLVTEVSITPMLSSQEI